MAVGTVVENPCSVGCGAIPNANAQRVVAVTDRNGRWTASAPLGLGRNVQVVQDGLGVDCETGGQCVIVGTVLGGSNGSGGTDALKAAIGVGSGAKWAFFPAPIVQALGAAHSLTSVGPVTCTRSCTMAGIWYDGAGVGHAAVISGAPGHWTTEALPAPPAYAGSVNLLINGVTCSNPGRCLIAATYDVWPAQRLLAYQSFNHKWSRVALPVPHGAQVDSQVAAACAPHGPCRIFASYFYDPGQSVYPLMVLSQSGKDWTRSSVGTPPGVWVSDPAAAACPSATSCVAVGGYVLRQVSGRWRTVALHSPGGSQGFGVGAVSCPRPRSCVAVGSYSDSNGYSQGLIESQAGGAWTPAQAPLPKSSGERPGVSLQAVSCPVVGTCFALGIPDNLVDNLAGQYAVIESLRSGTWRSTVVLLPSGVTWAPTEGGYTLPSEISCPSPTSCVAIANVIHSHTGAWAVLELSLGSRGWRASLIPVPGVPNVFLSDAGVNIRSLSCPAVGACVAAGLLDRQGQSSSLILQQTATGWTSHAFDTSAGIGLFGVACWKPGQCIATGDSVVKSVSGHWTDVGQPAFPPEDSQTVLTDVSCSNSGTCAAVSNYDFQAPEVARAFVDSYTAGRWTAFSDPSWEGQGEGHSLPLWVACPGPRSCIVAGATGSGGITVWTGIGEKWSSRVLPLPGRSASAWETGMACEPSGSCLMSGEDNLSRPILWSRSHNQWHATYAPEPAASHQGDFVGGSPAGISCPAAGACVAIGGYLAPGGLPAGFFEEQGGGHLSPRNRTSASKSMWDSTPTRRQFRPIRRSRGLGGPGGMNPGWPARAMSPCDRVYHVDQLPESITLLSVPPVPYPTPDCTENAKYRLSTVGHECFGTTSL
jgi:hypothetical protein